jgi:ribose transport system permease protein
MTTAQSDMTTQTTPKKTVVRPGEGLDAEGRSQRGQWVSRFIARYGLLVAWFLVAVIFSALPQTSAIFPTSENMATIFGSQAVIAILTLALVVPLVAGDYDLSVAFILTFSAMLIAVLNVEGHWPIIACIVVAVLAGAVVGVINASIVLFFRIDSLIVTLGTGTFLGGIVLWICNTNTISGISPGLVDWVIVNKLFGIPLEFYYAVAIGLLMWYVFQFLPIGQRLLFVGRGRNVARLCGIRVERMRMGAFVASGAISALAGVVYCGTSGAADPTSGTQLLLPAFAAAFLGATTIYPGRFNPIGALAAVYFLVTGITGLELLGAQSYVQDLFYGGALVVAVALSQLARGRQALSAGGA